MRFLVIGAAGHAQEVAWSLREQMRTRGESCEFVFFDDAIAPGRLPSGLGHVVGGLDLVGEHIGDGEVTLVLGVGLPRTKKAVVARLAALELPWATVVHPTAAIGPNVSLDEGSYVGAGAVLTVNIRVGQFATINTHCQVAHDDVLGNFVTLHPDAHLAGNVTVAEGCELGTGAVAIPGVTIGPWAIVGAGAVVVKTLPGDETYVGLPARARPVVSRDGEPTETPGDGEGTSARAISATGDSSQTQTKMPASRRSVRQ
jgi:sugar O-acyltransferase (sialic acid O-acetyltransferase NeuD family)